MANKEEQLETIDLGELNGVTGGVTTQADTSDQLMQAMESILSSVQALAQNNSGSGSSDQMMMMMMMMGMGGHQQAAAPAPSVPVGGVTADGWTRVS
ncbi:MAG: hypothetical protein QM831_17150 [Kofleriaceae bacterium]